MRTYEEMIQQYSADLNKELSLNEQPLRDAWAIAGATTGFAIKKIIRLELRVAELEAKLNDTKVGFEHD